MPRFYLTTAIDYSNGDPHLGHTMEKVGADCIARYRRLKGDDVHFLMGMDEHSQSVLQAAHENGVTPQIWVDRMAETFARYWKALHCSNTDWIRTTEPRHERGVAAFLNRIKERSPGDLFMGEYEGLYCTGCEEFKQPAQIEDGHCIEHPTLDLVPTRETNHFFRLSAYTERIQSLITSGEFAVEPAIRRNEILRLLESGLQDISISRSRFPWGIPFPGDPGQTVYVWFDALINYLSATGFPEEGYQQLWPADLHVIGKGITRFHCVIWPAMLLAAELPLPRKVWAHGYVQWEGAKMSKTAGTAVSLQSAMDRYGPDALRYFLLREVGFEQDGNFSWERFDERYTADLADGLGNLASRSLAMLVKYRAGVVPDAEGTELDQTGERALAEWERAMNALDLRAGAEAAQSLVAAANSYITRTAPWALAKSGDDKELDRAMTSLARCLARLTRMLEPFMPARMAELRAALGYPPGGPEMGLSLSDISTIAGQTVQKPDSLFPRPVT